MPDPSSLYPQPQQAGQGNALMGNPLDMMARMQQLQAGQLQLQQARAQQAGGQAILSGMRPDGTFDPAAAMKSADPNAVGAAGAEFGGNMINLRNSNTVAATNALALGVANNAAVANIVAPYAVKGDKIGNEDVYAIKAKLAAAGVDPKTIAAADINGVIKAAAAAKLAAAQGMGPGQAATPTPVAPDDAGRPQVAPLGATVGAVTPRPVGLPPGQTEAATGIAAASAAQSNTLTGAADTSPNRKAMLGNLETDLGQFTAGPNADWTKVAKAWANRNVLPSGMQFDPQSIASQEAFTKQAEQLAQQQFAAIGGTGTDAKFGSAFKSNPNETLSSLGNTGIIRLLKGNEDAIQAKNKAWQDWLAKGNPPQSYPQFAQTFNQNFDPRVYQSQYMSKDDFTKTLKAMSPAEQQAFVAKIKAEKAAGNAVSPGAYYSGQ